MEILAPNLLNTVVTVVPLRLGRVQHVHAKIGFHTVVVPSRHGGVLRIRFEDPAAHRLHVHTPDGRDFVLPEGASSMSIEVPSGDDGHGTFLVAVHASAPHYAIVAEYTEWAFARDAAGEPLIPWNFWYFPFAPAQPWQSAWASEVVRPLEKYERAFGRVGARAWEQEFHSDQHQAHTSWAGHCLDASIASVLFEPPLDAGVKHGRVQFSCEELKLLAAEVCGHYGNVELGWFPQTVAPFVVTEKPSDDPAKFGDAAVLGRFVDVVFAVIRDAGHPLLMDLRDAEGVDPKAVWNHAVFKYTASYVQEDVDDPGLVICTLELLANDDVLLPGGVGSGLPARVAEVDGNKRIGPSEHHRSLRLRFRMRFDAQGRMVLDASDNRWYWTHERGVDIFAPRNAAWVGPIALRDPQVQDGNPFVLLEDVEQLLTRRKLRPRPVLPGAPEGGALDLLEVGAGPRRDAKV